MPIDLKRDNVEKKLERLTYSKGLKIKREVAGFLASQGQAFRADEIVARIDTAANAIMVEAVLGHHEVFSYKIDDEKVYWYIEDSKLDEALEMSQY
jgi:hypothetical protein